MTTTSTTATPTLAGLLVGEPLRAARTVLAPLIDAHAAGWLTLPEGITAPVLAAGRLAAAHRASRAGATLDDARRTLAESLLDAATTAATLPGEETLAAAINDAPVAGAYRLALVEAHDTALRTATFYCYDHEDELVTEHLRPAHATAVDAARTSLDAYTRHGHDADALLASGDLDAQVAYMGMDTAAARYASVHHAAVTLVNAGRHVARDHAAEFAEMTNLRDLQPDTGTVPWPSGHRDRLAWLLGHGAELWCPTAAERDTAWSAKYLAEPALR